jgi:hypothetical protein
MINPQTRRALLLLACSLTGAGCTCFCPGAGAKGAPPAVHVRYYHAAGASYEEVVINGRSLKRTSIPAERRRELAAKSPAPASRRLWSQADLVTRGAWLAERELDDLVRRIEDAKFLELAAAKGRAGNGDGEPVETIQVRIGARENVATCRNTPENPPPPAFAAVRDGLLALARAKVPDA